ncbi:MAG: serine/threonine protein kinase [Gammaproteobacteria bacterium]|nr:serine/threonine protein kinase [Gammaproteobacteria bacterium]
MDLTGKEFRGHSGKYYIERLLARGGMGAAYEGKDQDGNKVIVKFPAYEDKAGNKNDPEMQLLYIEKLKIESKILKSLSPSMHPSIVQYVDESADSSRFFLVVEKLSGTTLDKVVSSSGLPEEDVIKFSLDILAGLEFMHQHNTIYRDLKPPNIIVTDDKRCVIIDFGASKQGLVQSAGNRLAKDGATVIGSPDWTCPEQEQGRVSEECDMYAFGRIMFYMITGSIPKRYSRPDGSMAVPLQKLKGSINTELADMIDAILDPQHKTTYTANAVREKIKKLGKLYSTKPAPLRTGKAPRIRGRRRPGNRASKIMLQSKEYVIPDKHNSGVMFSRRHDIKRCLKKKDSGCFRHNAGVNVLVGWECPEGCRCESNPQHFISEHHMMVWKDKRGNICVGNRVDLTRSAIRRNGRWMPINPHEKHILQDHDEVALLYNEQRGPLVTFTFHEGKP